MIEKFNDFANKVSDSNDNEKIINENFSSLDGLMSFLESRDSFHLDAITLRNNDIEFQVKDVYIDFNGIKFNIFSNHFESSFHLENVDSKKFKSKNNVHSLFLKNTKTMIYLHENV